MEITLEKIELVKDRTGVTYAEAKQALEEADGSVVDAIIAIEETVNAGDKKRGFGSKGEALFASIKEQVAKGNVSRIQVKKDDELVLNVPLNAGIVGLVIAPIASVIGVVAAFGFKCTIEIVKEDGTIIDISDAVSDTIGTVTEKGSAAFDAAKEKAGEMKAKAGEKAEEVKAKAEDVAADVKEKAADAKEKAEEVAADVKEKATDAKEKAEEVAADVKEKAEAKADEVKAKLAKDAEETAEAVEEAVEEAAEEAAEETVEE